MPKSASRPSIGYQSRFREWDEKSWVRSKPHQLAPFDLSLDFYSEPVSVLFSHPAVQAAPGEVRAKLLVLQLYAYLEFTVWLELGPVNEVCDLLRRPDFLPWLPSQMKDDALKIYVDEGGHAEMSHALTVATEEATGVKPLKVEPAFLGTLDRLIAEEEPEFHSLIKLFFVIISETLITGTLLTLPRDERVQVAVRDLAADHANDEGRHHAYFRQVFEYIWPRLPYETKLKVGVILPDMILAFLNPDVNTLTQMLAQFSETFPLPGKIVREIVDSDATAEAIKKAASPTLKMLDANHVFDYPEILTTFQAKRLSPLTLAE
jgi:P-aminobenzoate N-oxygenase AurF